MKIKQLYKLYKESYLVDTDTRKIRKNSIYFALKGDNFNGNKFAKEALEKGASYSIIDEETYEINEKTILVKNVLETLQELAKYHRSQLKIPVFGLTGSNGKTTSKELINAVLSKKYITFATQGNLNNHIGVPLSILSIKPEVEIAIIEMGANHQKEIEFLSSISNPDYGFITNFGKAHIEGFGGVEGVIKGKSELYENIRQNEKKVFVNEEDTKQMELTSDLNRTLFKPSEIEIISENPLLELKFKNNTFKTHLIGSYNSLNVAIALQVGNYFNVPFQDSITAISEYIPSNNRSQFIQTKNNKIHLDAYNANPSSVSLALKSFSRLQDFKKVLILGDMFELGKDSLKEHQEINNLAKELGFKEVYLVGSHYAAVKTDYLQFLDFSSLEEHLKNNSIKNTTILIKGSRGMALERTLDCLN